MSLSYNNTIFSRNPDTDDPSKAVWWAFRHAKATYETRCNHGVQASHEHDGIDFCWNGCYIISFCERNDDVAYSVMSSARYYFVDEETPARTLQIASLSRAWSWRPVFGFPLHARSSTWSFIGKRLTAFYYPLATLAHTVGSDAVDYIGWWRGKYSNDWHIIFSIWLGLVPTSQYHIFSLFPQITVAQAGAHSVLSVIQCPEN